MRWHTKRTSWVMGGLILAAAAVVWAVPDMVVSRSVIGSGGRTVIQGEMKLSATQGQTAVGNHWDSEGRYRILAGFWQPATGGVSAVDGADLPRQPQLYGNAPNPFNPMTEIRFTVGSEPTRARLVIYDIQGRRVRTLVDEVVPAGRQSVTWQGRNDQGGRVASGLYFYRLETGDEVFTRKMVLVK